MTDELTDEELSRMKPAKDVLNPELFEKLTAKSMTIHEEKARQIVEDGPVIFGSTAKHHYVSAIASALEEARKEAEARWMLAQKALNQIDDGFEYRYGDEKSRAFLHKVLANYTDAIRSRTQKENPDA